MIMMDHDRVDRIDRLSEKSVDRVNKRNFKKMDLGMKEYKF